MAYTVTNNLLIDERFVTQLHAITMRSDSHITYPKEEKREKLYTDKSDYEEF